MGAEVDDCTLLHPKGCGMCGKKLTGRQKRWCSRKCARDYTANHRWTQAKAAIKKANAHYQCQHCGNFVKDIEVDHIEPCRGLHGVWGCHHHADNLRLLCPPCHKARTRIQHENGEFK